ncbi:MAG: hypothetical protein D5R96_09420, partial [Methanocalculus sp. MSAO_Arc2]
MNNQPDTAIKHDTWISTMLTRTRERRGVGPAHGLRMCITRPGERRLLSLSPTSAADIPRHPGTPFQNPITIFTKVRRSTTGAEGRRFNFV